MNSSPVSSTWWRLFYHPSLWPPKLDIMQILILIWPSLVQRLMFSKRSLSGINYVWLQHGNGRHPPQKSSMRFCSLFSSCSIFYSSVVLLINTIVWRESLSRLQRSAPCPWQLLEAKMKLCALWGIMSRADNSYTRMQHGGTGMQTALHRWCGSYGNGLPVKRLECQVCTWIYRETEREEKVTAA